MGAIASQIISLTSVFSTVYSDADQRKHQNYASLAFARGIHPCPLRAIPTCSCLWLNVHASWWYFAITLFQHIYFNNLSIRIHIHFVPTQNNFSDSVLLPSVLFNIHLLCFSPNSLLKFQHGTHLWYMIKQSVCIKTSGTNPDKCYAFQLYIFHTD